MGRPPGSGPLTITGPANLSIGAGDSAVSAAYTANRTDVAWTVTVLSDGSLDPSDYTISISPSGVLTVELAPGVVIPASGTDLVLRIGAQRGGGGGVGNSDTLDVTVSIAPGVVPCFVAGTFIRTARGEVRVEELRIGDLVLNREGWPCPVVWIGARRLSRRQLEAAPHLAPVRIRRNAFGEGRPYADLLVSPQHRVMVDGWRAELLLGRERALAHAVHLVDGGRVAIAAPEGDVHYLHFCLQSHDIVWSNGLCTETLLLGRMALRGYDARSVSELLLLFPELDDDRRGDAPAACLPVASRMEAQALALAKSSGER
jgi:hypothetical protein